MIIRRFNIQDANAVSDLIATTLRISNRKDYSAEYLENDIQCLQPKDIIARANRQHFYVVEENGNIIGCGSTTVEPIDFKPPTAVITDTFTFCPEHETKNVGQKTMIIHITVNILITFFVVNTVFFDSSFISFLLLNIYYLVLLLITLSHSNQA